MPGASPGMLVGVGGLIYNAISAYLDIVTGGGKLESAFLKIRRFAKIVVRCHDYRSVHARNVRVLMVHRVCPNTRLAGCPSGQA